MSPTLDDRVEALSAAADLARGHLADTEVDAAVAVVEKVQGRLGHGTSHTVIAVAGPTGAGKSSLFNALTGVEISSTGVRRPTTSVTHACIWGDDGGPLLDWLGITQRHHIDATESLGGLILLDLPDHDSTAEAHRIEVDRLVELVDLLVWVTDPQKYADLALHERYLRPLAGHGEAMRFVLNKVDTLDDDQQAACVLDFGDRVADDGIADPVVLGISVTTGDGIDELRRMLETEVADKRAAVRRVSNDLRIAAETLSTGGSSDGVSRKGRKALIAGLGRAAGSEAAGSIMAAQHRRDAKQTMGWPPMRLLRRWGRHPIADLPRAENSPVAEAEVRAALRDVGEDAAEGMSGDWPGAVRRTAQQTQPEVLASLTRVTGKTARANQAPPRWWSAVRSLQWLLALVAAAGLIWLLALAVLGGFFKLDTDPLLIDTPGADWIPLPSLLLLGGLALGIVVAILARVPANVGARRRARRTQADIEREVAGTADTEVLGRLDDLLERQNEMEHLLVVAATD